jgi:hypothetical protein
MVTALNLYGQTSPVDNRVPVKVKKTVHVKMVNCQYGIPLLKQPCWTDSDVDDGKRSLKERFAQVGVKLEITVVPGPDIGLGGYVDDYPVGNYTPSGYQIDIPKETANIFKAVPASSSDEIVLYLIRRCSGYAAPSGVTTPEKYLNSAQKAAGYGAKSLVSPPSFYGDLFTAPHELLHALLDAKHDDYNKEFNDAQMLWSKTTWKKTINDSRRISVVQEAKIHLSRFAK